MTAPLLGVVLGSPVSQSLSPAIHEAAFRAAGRSGRFEAWECTADELGPTIERVRASGAVGASVTMPLKEAIVGLCDGLDPTAAILGAVNCLRVGPDGLVGYNTDGDGCCDALERHGGATVEGSAAVVLGAGGTARSVCFALASRGSSVSVVNRTASRAAEVARLNDSISHPRGAIRVGSIDDIASSTLLVNATSVGMGSQQSPVERGVLHPGLTVLDAVYHPLETRLLGWARECGARSVDGLWMLIEQARRQQQVWFGDMPDGAAMRAESLRVLSSRPN